MKKENLLTALILLGLAAGVVIGQYFIFDPTMSPAKLAEWSAPWRITGEILFIRPLNMLIVPLVFVSVVVGVTSIGNPQKLGVIGGATAAYFLCTTLIAVVLGLALVNLIQPGVGVSTDQMTAAAKETFDKSISQKIESGPADVGASFLALARQMVPDNPLKAAVERDVLGVVVFAILLGLALVVTGEPAAAAVRFFEALFNALMRLVMWVIWLGPIGVLCIVAARVGEVGLASLVGPMGKYMLTVVIGLAIHLFLILPLILWLLGRVNPYGFLWRMRKVIVTAFSTASSNATLPVTLEESQKQGGCSRRAANFVIPLGATVNMNGTALYEAVAVSFLFQMFGYELGLTQQLLILITATLAAIGAAGIPSAGLVTMAIVIGATNASLAAVDPSREPLPLWTIGIIYGVDRVLDMCRTVVNVMGDVIGARLITRIAPDE